MPITKVTKCSSFKRQSLKDDAWKWTYRESGSSPGPEQPFPEPIVVDRDSLPSFFSAPPPFAELVRLHYPIPFPPFKVDTIRAPAAVFSPPPKVAVRPIPLPQIDSPLLGPLELFGGDSTTASISGHNAGGNALHHEMGEPALPARTIFKIGGDRGWAGVDEKVLAWPRDSEGWKELGESAREGDPTARLAVRLLCGWDVKEAEGRVAEDAKAAVKGKRRV